MEYNVPNRMHARFSTFFRGDTPDPLCLRTGPLPSKILAARLPFTSFPLALPNSITSIDCSLLKLSNVQTLIFAEFAIVFWRWLVNDYKKAIGASFGYN